MIILIVSLLILVAAYILWQYIELGKFSHNVFEWNTNKLKNDKKIVLVSDLHGHVYGNKNDVLIQNIKQIQPDLILIPGDLIVSKNTKTYDTALMLLHELIQIAPVFFSNGNHESRPKREKHKNTEEYLEFEAKMIGIGVHVLNNEALPICLQDDKIIVHGLDLALDYYEKGITKQMDSHVMEDYLGELEEKDKFHILLAHNPAYCKEYTAWGADLTVSGHNHGGLVRLPNGRSFISPQFQLFPKYDAGHFVLGEEKHVVVSRGLGTHTFHIRIFNRAELVQINLKAMHEN